jgi:hypothetical protein
MVWSGDSRKGSMDAMTVGIICKGLASGMIGAPYGQWLRSYDPDAHNGRGEAQWTTDASLALAFSDAVEAHSYWTQTSRTMPIRPDGKPNRPLTAFTVEVAPLP